VRECEILSRFSYCDPAIFTRSLQIMQVIAAGQQYAVFPRDHKQNKLILSQQQLSGQGSERSDFLILDHVTSGA